MHGTLNCRHSYTRILALDLGKFNSVLCDFDPATGNHRFESLETTPQAIHDLLAGLAGHEPAKEVVVMETCDTSGWVYDIGSGRVDNYDARIQKFVPLTAEAFADATPSV